RGSIRDEKANAPDLFFELKIPAHERRQRGKSLMALRRAIVEIECAGMNRIDENRRTVSLQIAHDNSLVILPEMFRRNRTHLSVARRHDRAGLDVEFRRRTPDRYAAARRRIARECD